MTRTKLRKVLAEETIRAVQAERERCAALVAAKPKVGAIVSTWYFSRDQLLFAIMSGKPLDELLS